MLSLFILLAVIICNLVTAQSKFTYISSYSLSIRHTFTWRPCCFFLASYVSSSCFPGTCSEYGVGAVSECTSGFASLYHIDTIEGNTNIRSYSVQRQSIFPDITFNCSGKITKWVFAANWEGNSLAHTELQIWRKRGNRNVYDRVGSTTVRVSSRNITEVYEHVVNPPLAFQEGDILGYFQPYGGTSQLNLYLEESERTMSIIRLPSDEEDESDDDSGQQSNVINLNSGHLRGNDYPLIHVETGIVLSTIVY